MYECKTWFSLHGLRLRVCDKRRKRRQSPSDDTKRRCFNPSKWAHDKTGSIVYTFPRYTKLSHVEVSVSREHRIRRACCMQQRHIQIAFPVTPKTEEQHVVWHRETWQKDSIDWRMRGVLSILILTHPIPHTSTLANDVFILNVFVYYYVYLSVSIYVCRYAT